MELTINGKNYPLTFGIKALEMLDAEYSLEQNGAKLGGGIMYASVLYEMGAPKLLPMLISAGLLASKAKPSMESIDAFIDSLDMEEYDALYKDVYENFTKTPRVAYQINKLMNQ